jgi:hypothetical protein
MRQQIVILLAAITISSCAGCSWSLCFWKRSKPKYDKGVFQVRVIAPYGRQTPVRARAYVLDDGERDDLVANHLVSGNGVVGFVLPLEAEYEVEAHADLDADGRRDRGEPVASIGGLRARELSEPEREPVILRLPGAARGSETESADPVEEPAMPGLGMPAILERLRQQAPELLGGER